VGKSSFVAWLVSELDGEGYKVAIVSEEGEAHWKRRADQYQYSDSVSICCRPFNARPTMQQWQAFIDGIAALDVHVVVFDTLPNLWPCRKENDSDEVIPSLTPLTAIMERQRALLLLHHAGKSDKAEGMAARGSNALTGWVDVMLEMRRVNADDPQDQARSLAGWGRFDDVPAEIVVERTSEGYRVLGNKADAVRSRYAKTIQGILQKQEPGIWLTVTQIEDEWPEAARKPKQRTIRNELNNGWKHELWHREGAGNKISPLRYSCKPVPAGTVVEAPPLGCCSPLKGGLLQQQSCGVPAMHANGCNQEVARTIGRVNP
jgi:hypothetical protein